MCTRIALGAIAVMLLDHAWICPAWADTTVPHGIVGQFFLSEEERSQWHASMEHPLVLTMMHSEKPVISVKKVDRSPVSQPFELNGYIDSERGRSIWVNQRLHSATALKSKKLRPFKMLKPGQRITWQSGRPISQESYDRTEPFLPEVREEQVLEDSTVDNENQP
jgi:hypothetical protein